MIKCPKCGAYLQLTEASVADRVRRSLWFGDRFSLADLADRAGVAISEAQGEIDRLVELGYIRPLGDKELHPPEKATKRQWYVLVSGYEFLRGAI